MLSKKKLVLKKKKNSIKSKKKKKKEMKLINKNIYICIMNKKNIYFVQKIVFTLNSL